MTELLLDTPLDPEQRGTPTRSRPPARRCCRSSTTVLDFSKIEAGKLDLEEIEFSPRTVLAGVVDLLAGAAQAKGLELVAVVGSSVPEIVRGDPGRLRQVLTNSSACEQVHAGRRDRHPGPSGCRRRQ